MRLLLIVALLAPRIASASDDAPWAHASCSESAFVSGEPVTGLHQLRAGYAALRDGSHEDFVGNEAYRLGVSKTEGAAFTFGQIHALRWRAVHDELNEATERFQNDPVRSWAAQKKAAEAKYAPANCGLLLKKSNDLR